MSDTVNTNKPGRGRPKGAGSFANVTVGSLLSVVGEKTVVKVGRLWLAEQGITVVNNEATRKTVEAAPEPVAATSTVEASVQLS